MIFGSMGTSVPERDSSFFFFQISYINIRLLSDPESSSPVYVNNFQTEAKILYFERNTRPILNLFFYLKRRNLSLDNRKRITTIYVTV
jgi:hypothetical protein